MVKSPFLRCGRGSSPRKRGHFALSTLPPAAKAAAPSGGGYRSFETVAKQETESSRMAKLRFCGADEARTRDPRRDRPVF